MASPNAGIQSLVGQVVAGRFRIVQHLGSGGTGHVYLAEALEAEQPNALPRNARERAKIPKHRLALKVLSEENRDGLALARFEREALAAARVRHANVLEIIEVHVTTAAVPCFAMELLVGLDLADTLSYHRALGPARAAGIAVAAAAGIAAAHDVGVVHRDIKPENLFLVHSPDGREIVKLVDFGFAWLPEDGRPDKLRKAGRRLAIGTPEYMAPEQARGCDGDLRADIYSLGIVLYEMLTGRVPFVGSYPAIAEKHAANHPPMRSLRPTLTASSEMEGVVLRAIAKDPAKRFASIADFREALLSTREASGVFARRELDK